MRLHRLTATALALTLGWTASAQDSADPLRITLNDWTGQLISARIMGEVLKTIGTNVEYVQADYLAQFAGLESGDLHLAMELWETTAREAIDASVATGKFEVVGPTGLMAKEDWWYPLYMKEHCPGLPNWEALLEPSCAEAFATAETMPKGRYLGGAVTWGGFDEERVEALDLPFEVIHAGTDAAMFSELESAIQRQAPIIMWIYSPHWAPIKFEGEWVEFPEYTKECYEDPAWGVNPDLAYDCGKPFGNIWKGASVVVKDKWPKAYKAIQAFALDNETMGAMIAEVDLEGKKVEEVVEAWMAANEPVWKAWLQ